MTPREVPAAVRLDGPLSERITAVGQELATAFRDLVAAVPGHPSRPQGLARILDIDKSVSHRLVTAIRKGDPVATAHTIPGPEPLRRIAKAARRHNVASALTERAELAVQALEELIRDEGGDRSGLDAIISTWLPSARERFEKLAKQTMYRGARQLKGLAADITFAANLIHPSASDPLRCDTASVFGYVGLHRIRPEAKLKLGVLSGTSNPAARPLTIARKPIEEPIDVLWHRYCSQPEIELGVHPVPGSNTRVYELEWRDAVGPNSARNVIMCELLPNGVRRYRLHDDPQPKAGLAEYIEVPTKRLVFDVIMHAEVFPDWRPLFRAIMTGPRGMANPNDPTRDSDVLPIVEDVEFLGSGLERFRAEEIPAYIEMLGSMCEAMGWDPRSFRGYRVSAEYPVFGSELQFVFDLPLAPSISA
jgi:hypothetical protein